jgi:peptidoglycan hydrolase FlgJ
VNPLESSRTFDSAVQGLATDAHSLDALRRTAGRDPQAALKGAAQQFEALFLQMVLKSMRDAIPKSGLLESDSEQTYTGMLDQQLAAQISHSGTGLADVIARQLGRYVVAPQDGAPKPADGHAGIAAPVVQAALDRYAAMAGSNPNTALREAELQRSNAAARAAYLQRRDAVSNPADTSAGVHSATADLTVRDDQRAFVSEMWEHAAAAQQATGIPAHFVLAQAALESGWGRREIRDSAGVPTYNLFGIKAGSGWKGPTVDVVTTEYDNGVARKVVDKFRAYANYADAFRDWAQLIGNNRRYTEVVQSGQAGGSAAGFANGLARAGYATDPDYGAKLVRVIGSIASARAGDG